MQILKQLFDRNRVYSIFFGANRGEYACIFFAFCGLGDRRITPLLALSLRSYRLFTPRVRRFFCIRQSWRHPAQHGIARPLIQCLRL